MCPRKRRTGVSQQVTANSRSDVINLKKGKMGKVLIIGAGGVGTVVANKVAQNSPLLKMLNGERVLPSKRLR